MPLGDTLAFLSLVPNLHVIQLERTTIDQRFNALFKRTKLLTIKCKQLTIEY